MIEISIGRNALCAKMVPRTTFSHYENIIDDSDVETTFLQVKIMEESRLSIKTVLRTTFVVNREICTLYALIGVPSYSFTRR